MLIFYMISLFMCCIYDLVGVYYFTHINYNLPMFILAIGGYSICLTGLTLILLNIKTRKK
jgi:hypothetical protein